MSDTCVHYDEGDAFDGSDNGPVCGKPATHHSCCWGIPSRINVCAEHKCRCAQDEPSPPDPRDARIAELEAELREARAQLAELREASAESERARQNPIWARMDAVAARMLALPPADLAARVVDLEAQLAERLVVEAIK